jgi:hypothetical protein
LGVNICWKTNVGGGGDLGFLRAHTQEVRTPLGMLNISRNVWVFNLGILFKRYQVNYKNHNDEFYKSAIILLKCY